MDGWLLARDKLAQEAQTGRPAPTTVPTELSLDEIKVCEEVFQHRSGLPAYSAAHVDGLVKVLDRGNIRVPLAPLTVFWIGKHWYCIDGHHRIKAYRKALYYLPVPVTVFGGTLDQAIAEALRGNSKDKLPMSQQEKSEAAWRLVVGTELSKAMIASAACVSESSVAIMRRAREKLTKERPDLALDRLTWQRARREASGAAMAEKGSEDWIEKEAQELANTLARHTGKRLGSNIEVAARALEIYSQPLVDGLIEHWASGSADDEIDDEIG